MKRNKTVIDARDFDRKIRPQDDFYHFACGNWLRNNPIPKTEVVWGSFTILRDKNRKRIQGIFKELTNKKNLKKGSSHQQLRDFYLSGMDEKKIKKLGLKPIAPFFANIDKIVNIDDLMKMVASMHKVGMGVLWNTSADLDDKNSEKIALYINQGSLGLPDKEYYLSKKDKFVDIRKKYLQHVQKILKLSGVENKEAQNATQAIIEIETKLAQASMSAEEKRDVEKTYNKMSIAKLQKLAPNVDWLLYLKNIDAKDVRQVVVGQVQYLKILNSMLKKVSLSDWRYYMRWHLVSHVANFLPKDIDKENFSFYSKILLGTKEMEPRWQRVYTAVDTGLTESLGEEYVSRYFSKNSEKILFELIEDIKDVFGGRIKDLDWMSPRTKKLAQKKLSTFRSKIGAPKNPRNYSKIIIEPDAYLHNFFNATQFEFTREIKKLKKPIDRNEWYMGAHVVNAYYWSNQNEIVFPAGILQNPFFYEKGDIAVNYGAIGAIIGHELTHGFDDKGSLFDAKGNLHNWWTKKDRDLFNKKTEVVVKQYNKYVAVEELHVNGKLTLGENIADLGGVVLAYYALQKYMERHGRLPDIGGLTPEQRFFFGLIDIEKRNTKKEIARFHAICDPHAPGYTRVNGPLSNLEEFYEAFDVKKGDGMYKQPNKRAKIW